MSAADAVVSRYMIGYHDIKYQIFRANKSTYNILLGLFFQFIWTSTLAVILLPAHHAAFVHNFVSGMQSFYFSESQDAIVL